MSSLNSSSVLASRLLDSTNLTQQLVSQQTDPSMFSDIKNQVIVEAGEKREASPAAEKS